jgi:hypothetical protein
MDPSALLQAMCKHLDGARERHLAALLSKARVELQTPETNLVVVLRVPADRLPAFTDAVKKRLLEVAAHSMSGANVMDLTVSAHD